jgi:hypothetical protein
MRRVPWRSSRRGPATARWTRSRGRVRAAHARPVEQALSGPLGLCRGSSSPTRGPRTRAALPRLLPERERRLEAMNRRQEPTLPVACPICAGRG